MASKKRQAESTKTAKRKKKITKRQQQKRKLIIFGIEVLCLILLLGVLYVWSLWSKISINDFNNADAGINEDLGDDTLLTLKGYTNIALFGLDNRTQGEYDSGQSDVIMIASINNETKEVKLVSVYRDTYLSIGDGKYNKANAAYAKGGAKQAVQMLNSNLDLNITEYVCVDWAAVVEVVDALGGIEVEVNDAEAEQMMGCIAELNMVLGTNSSFVSGKDGLQTLDGVQATAYARVRKTAGNDFKRSSRQRIVLEAMLNKAKESDVSTLLKICNAVFDDISTSLTLNEIIGLAQHVTEYTIGSTTGFPFEMTTKQLSGSGDTVIPIGLEDDVTMLHEYMFGTVDYEPSRTVQAISEAIIKKTGVTEKYQSIDVSDFNDTAGQTGTDFTETED